MRLVQACLLEHANRSAARITRFVMACVPTLVSQALSDCLYTCAVIAINGHACSRNCVAATSPQALVY